MWVEGIYDRDPFKPSDRLRLPCSDLMLPASVGAVRLGGGAPGPAASAAAAPEAAPAAAAAPPPKEEKAQVCYQLPRELNSRRAPMCYCAVGGRQAEVV